MRTDFGVTASGERVERLVLRAGSLSVALLTLGARVQDLRLSGVDHTLTVGSDDLATFEGAFRYHGAIVGPVANRIGGARASIGSRAFRFPANEGRNTLHSGPRGTHARVWEVTEAGDDRATLRLALPADEDGFPGNRTILAAFRVESPARLCLDLSATTDAPTFLNLANHSYWCLAGPGRGGMTLRSPAGRWLPVDAADKLPTGEIADVAGTPFDFRAGRPVGGKGYDHCLCLSPLPAHPPAPAAELSGGGLTMLIESTAPGLQVFDGLPDGVALEPQGWPDAPNRPGFPPVVVRPGEVWRQETRWTFARS